MNRSAHGRGRSVDGSNHGPNARSTDRVPSVDILSPHAHATTDGVHVGKIGGDEGDEFLRKSINPAAVIEERESGEGGGEPTPEQLAARDRMLGISFLAMVFIGSMNKIFNKLETGPMYNYPNFLNLLTTFMYIPLSFAYVIPAIRAGWIGDDQLSVPKKNFAVMGFLDCLAGIMQTFATTYLKGSLVVLLVQAAIPVSMILSALMLNVKYHVVQYVSALIVCAGIVTVLAPSLFGGDDDEDSSPTWALVLILSTVPMVLSSVYKEIALGDTDLDPIYLNAWIALFQFFFSIPLAIPAALVTTPPVYPSELPRNLYEGLKCYVGVSSIECTDDNYDDDSYDGTCKTDECGLAPAFVNVYLLFNVSYNILIIMILKWGSSNILWLAMTVMVPIGNLAFALPFMPNPSHITPFDIMGLVVIMVGLVGYRAGPDAAKNAGCCIDEDKQDLLEDDELRKNLDEPLMQPSQGASSNE